MNLRQKAVKQRQKRNTLQVEDQTNEATEDDENNIVIMIMILTESLGDNA